MDSFSQFQASVELCNQRAVIQEEYLEYRKLADLSFESLDDYKGRYYHSNAPRRFFIVVSFLAAYFMTYPWLFNFFGSLNWFPLFSNGLAILILVILMALIYNLVFKRIYWALNKDVVEKFQQTVGEYFELLPQIIAMRDDAHKRLKQFEQYMLNNDNCIIPEKYWHKANELFSLIKNKRATDIVSAINKYEDIQHQVRMEGMAAQSMAYNEMAMYAAEQARANSELAAKKAGEAAFASKVNLFYTLLQDSDS